MCYARYQALYGAGLLPATEEDASPEQLGCSLHLIVTNQTPYCDFSLFGPRGLRLLRKMRLFGSVFHSDGSIHSIEIKGPPTFDSWQLCFAVFRTACTLLDVADLGTIITYEKLVARYHIRYGPAAWLILYQADVRTRAELWPRIRLRLETAHQVAASAGHTTPFDPLRPWNYTILMSMEDTKGWHIEVEETSLLLASRSHWYLATLPLREVSSGALRSLLLHK
jgi:hypothetical protein